MPRAKKDAVPKADKGPSPFDYVKVILNGQSQMQFSSQYVPFIVNRAVAHHRDNIIYCQLLNELTPTPKQHYDFLFNQIPKRNRSFEKWVSSKKEKTEESEEVVLLADYYQCSLEKAQEYHALTSAEFISELRQVGGGVESRSK